MGAELDEAGIAHTGSDPESDGVSAMGDVANTVGEHMKEHSQDIGKHNFVLFLSSFPHFETSQVYFANPALILKKI